MYYKPSKKVSDHDLGEKSFDPDRKRDVPNEVGRDRVDKEILCSFFFSKPSKLSFKSRYDNVIKIIYNCRSRLKVGDKSLIPKLYNIFLSVNKPFISNEYFYWD